MGIRINNIEFNHDQNQIVRWFPNSHYGSEESLIAMGYERVVYEDGGWAMKNGCRSIDSSCFRNPESCCVIATMEYNKEERCCDLTTTGTRVLDLKKGDRKDFFEVYRLAEKLIRKSNR